MLQRRFTVLLIAMMAFLLATPAFQRMALEGGPLWPRALVIVLLAIMLLSAVFAVSMERTVRVIAIALAAAALAGRLLDTLIPGTIFEVLHFALMIGCLGLIAALIMRTLFQPIRVTGETISASLCVYLLLVLIWAFAYAILDALEPGSFAYSLAATLGPDADTSHSVLPVYFSLVTITTLGYGDIVPATAPAQMLASIEAFVGQMYIAILVARLVALYSTDDPADPRHGGR